MDADGDRKASPYNSVDAIFSTARYLRASGAPRSYRKALFAYNHAGWYVDRVLATEKQFR
jgi:membrane-bound lytic murein transglycosylase B